MSTENPHHGSTLESLFEETGELESVQARVEQKKVAKIRYVTGDATDPAIEEGQAAIIAHVCNDGGMWGAGFSGAISRKWKEPEECFRNYYKASYRDFPPRNLGDTTLIRVRPGLFVANMIAQQGIRRAQTDPPVIRYAALRECLKELARWAKLESATVHMPRIGCGLAGGTWEEVLPILEETMRGIDVTVYDLP